MGTRNPPQLVMASRPIAADVCHRVPMWTPGDVVVLRYRSMSGGYGSGLPLRVIQDTGEAVIAWLAEGTEIAWPRLADGRGLRDVPLAERFAHLRISARGKWHSSDLVMIFPRGRRHSLWCFHHRGVHTGWYVNLEEPHVFGERTISSRDAVLDVWIPADTLEPYWKDEDEFAVAIDVGRISAEDATAFRDEGERVIAERPWPTGWEGWTPPTHWERPALPKDWATLD